MRGEPLTPIDPVWRCAHVLGKARQVALHLCLLCFTIHFLFLSIFDVSSFWRNNFDAKYFRVFSFVWICWIKRHYVKYNMLKYSSEIIKFPDLVVKASLNLSVPDQYLLSHICTLWFIISQFDTHTIHSFLCFADGAWFAGWIVCLIHYCQIVFFCFFWIIIIISFILIWLYNSSD